MRRPIVEAPRNGERIWGHYDGDQLADLIYWADTRYCMIGAPQGSKGPGWLSVLAGNLPVDEPPEWSPAEQCTLCCGLGWTQESEPECCGHAEHECGGRGCDGPYETRVQVQCAGCEATGWVEAEFP